MIGHSMNSQGLRSRVLLRICASVFGAAVVGIAALSTTIALTAGDVSTAPPSSGKTGPGYARMQPINLGKPEKAVESMPYRPHTDRPRVSRHKQLRLIIVPQRATIGPPM